MPHSALYVLVLVAAVNHASWNAMVKSSGDRLLWLTSIRVVGLLAGIAVAAWVPLPVVLSVGIVFLALSGNSFNRNAVVLALLTGVAIASYGFLIGLGIRKSQSILGYIAWLEIATGVGTAMVAYVRRKSVIVEFARTQWRSGLIAGLFPLRAKLLPFGLCRFLP